MYRSRAKDYVSRGANSLRPLQHEQVEHGIGKAIGRRLGDFLSQLLVELTLEHFFRMTTVQVRPFFDRLPHGTEHLSENRFAHELAKGIARLDISFVELLLFNSRKVGSHGVDLHDRFPSANYCTGTLV